MDTSPFEHIRVALRGGGDLGSGVAYRLHRCGFPILITELEHPLLVRRMVSFGSAVIEGEITIDGITARRADDLQDALAIQSNGEIAVLVDPDGKTLPAYTPTILIDARMNKAEPEAHPVSPLLIIGLGPGFTTPEHCHAVIETNRGHNLGKVIWEGAAEPDTGEPGRVLNSVSSRVLHAPTDGVVTGLASIGDRLVEGQPIARVSDWTATAPFEGILRGLIHDGQTVRAGTKIGDIDPRGDPSYCFTISEKSLAIGGGVLEAIFSSPAIRERIKQVL